METCSECGKEIKVQIQRGSGVCSELCRKSRDGEVERPQPLMDAGITNIIAQPQGVNLNGIR